MQKRMFVFIGMLPANAEAGLNELLEKLNARFKTLTPRFSFNRNGNNILAQMADVSFHASFLKDADELDNWITLASDSDLDIDLGNLDRTKLAERYEEVKKSSPNLYTAMHYSAALEIFEEMSAFPGVKIYSFQ